MRIDQFTFGSIRTDGVVYEHDVVIARGRVRKRKKKSSNPSAMLSATPPCPSRRTSRGTAGAWWSGPGPQSDDTAPKGSVLLAVDRELGKRASVGFPQ